MYMSGGPMMPPPTSLIAQKLDSIDDRHIAAKHREIHPTDAELSFVQRQVFNVEKALKMLSEEFNFAKAEYDTESASSSSNENSPSQSLGNGDDMAMAKERDDINTEASKISTKPKETESQEQCLKGVARVGLLAKGLLVHGDDIVDLVIICQAKPTIHLLEHISSNLPTYLSKCSTSNASSGSSTNERKERYQVVKRIEDASILVKTENKKCAENGSTCETETLTIRLRLTSPSMRMDDEIIGNEQHQVDVKGSTATQQSIPVMSDQDVLDRKSCLESLAELRQAKWFQVKPYLILKSI